MNFITRNTHRVIVTPVKSAGLVKTIMKSKALFKPELDFGSVIIAGLDKHDRCRIAIPVLGEKISMMNIFMVTEATGFDPSKVNAVAQKNLNTFLSELKSKGYIAEAEIIKI